MKVRFMKRVGVETELDYLTRGKVYEVTSSIIEKGMVSIEDDDGAYTIIRLIGCAHIGGLPWEIVEE